ncbi:MAG: PKD domain-containing protein [Candidatus Magasanikbacteria bacterium]|nr:PKD domain-containing protein [Candidatus Magasanikbacteria bacterium]
MKKHNILTVLSLLPLLFLSDTVPVQSEARSIIISEICPTGCASKDHQWIEIFNSSSSTVNMENWKFWENDTNHGLQISPSSTQQDWLLNPNEYAIIAQNDELFFQDHPNVTSTVFDSSWGTLNKSGEQIAIKSGTTDSDIIEIFTYKVAVSSSLERIDFDEPAESENNWMENPYGGSPGQKNYWHTEKPEEKKVNFPPIAAITGTTTAKTNEEISFSGEESLDSDGEIKKFEWFLENSLFSTSTVSSINFSKAGNYTISLKVTDNLGASSTATLFLSVIEETDASSTPPNASSTPDFSSIKINEFVSDPTSGEKEWIELYNSSSSSIDLNDCTLYDGNNQIFAPSSTISEFGFLVITLPSSKLNNSGDIIIFKNPNAEIIDQVSYGDWEDESLDNNAPTASDPNSIARNTDGLDSDIDKDDFSLTTTPTPGRANQITSPSEDNSNRNENYDDTADDNDGETENIYYDPSDIVINEIVSDPVSGESEFVELYNNTTKTIDLENWYIKEGGDSKTNLEGNIKSKKFFVIEKPKGNLNNSGDIIKLFDPNDNLIDEVSYGTWDDGDINDNAPLANDPYSGARVEDGADTDEDNKDFSLTKKITKGKANVIETPEDEEEENSEEPKTEAQKDKEKNNDKIYLIQDYINIEISEFIPNPAGVDSYEFIEIYNSGETAIDLDGLLLDDEDGGSKPFPIPFGIIIEPGQYLAFFREETKISINNTNDKIRLLLPNELVIKEVEFEKSYEGQSYALSKDGNRYWTSVPTPGLENIFHQAKPSSEKTEINNSDSIITSDIASAKNLQPGSRIKTEGLVIIEPGILGTQYFYIMAADYSAGIQVYMYKKDFPDLAIGDYIEVSGELSETAGEKRIKLQEKNDIKIISHTEPPRPRPIEISQLTDAVVGLLVKISGEITEIKGSHMYIDDGSDEVKVYFKKNTKIDKKNFQVGELVDLIGIVQKTKDGFQILPRKQIDIAKTGYVEEVIEKKELIEEDPDKSKEMAEKYLTATAGGLTSIIVGLFIKARGAIVGKGLKRVGGLFVGIVRKKR